MDVSHVTDYVADVVVVGKGVHQLKLYLSCCKLCR